MDTQITLTEEQMKAFQNGETITLTPPKKHTLWNPSNCDGYIKLLADSSIERHYACSYVSIYGGLIKRNLPSEAIEVSDDLIEFLRIKRYQYTHDRDDEGNLFIPDWSNVRTRKFCVVYNRRLNEFVVGSWCTQIILGVTYFSENVAKALAKKLNNGTVCFKTGKGC
jgi:hypothetical protein